jgi:hypothetical protein
MFYVNVNVFFTICPHVPWWLHTKCHVACLYFKLSVWNFAHTLLVDTIGITIRVMARYATFLLHFKHGGKKTLFKNSCFDLCIFFYQIYCVIFSYVQFTFPQTSKYFLSNGTNKIHGLASGPELQAVRFGYFILCENWKKGGYPF